MANFQIAHAITARNEGGYANSKADLGGETMLGVARNHHPTWAGWPLLDALKKKPGFPGTANANAELKQLAHAFYKKLFWDALRLDSVSNQALANALYDFGVNAGTGRAAGILQRAMNLTGAAQVAADGQMGPQTVAALNAHAKPALLLKTFSLLRGSFYLSLAEKNPSQKVFVASWLSRISLT